MTIAVFLFSLLGAMALGIPIAFALLVCGAALMWHLGLFDAQILAQNVINGADSYPLLAVPFFLLAGEVMNAGGLSRRIVELALAIVGHIKGGLGYVTILAACLLAALSGSAVADAAALGSILIPAMRSRGYSKEFAASVISSSATLAVIIPPSIPMLLYAVIAGTSVVKLFVSGIVPGIIGGLGMMGVAYWFARRYNFPVEQSFRWANVRKTFREALWAFLLPVIILGSIFGGIVTATEGAAIAVLAALFVGFVVYRELDVEVLRTSIIDGGVQTAVVMLLVAASALLGVYLTETHLPQQLAQGILNFTANKWAVLAILNVLFLILGFFLHSAAAIILVVPVVMPLVTAVGIDPVHFGLIVTINLGIGQQTPPVASVLMTCCAIAKADMWEVTKVNVYFVAVLLAVLMLVTYVPFVGMGLVDFFYQ